MWLTISDGTKWFFLRFRRHSVGSFGVIIRCTRTQVELAILNAILHRLFKLGEARNCRLKWFRVSWGNVSNILRVRRQVRPSWGIEISPPLETFGRKVECAVGRGLGLVCTGKVLIDETRGFWRNWISNRFTKFCVCSVDKNCANFCQVLEDVSQTGFWCEILKHFTYVQGQTLPCPVRWHQASPYKLFWQ